MLEVRMMQPNGSIFFKDEYDVIYNIDWSTVGDVIDLTSVTSQPGVWGKRPEGYIKHGILYRKGIITAERQVLRIYTGGYEIVAAGISQYEDFIQMNFPCQQGPKDNFKYHLNNSPVDDLEFRTRVGPRWADPNDPYDDDMVWCDLDVSGNPIPQTGEEPLAFIDVWAN
jgi:hypothetical protein